MTPADVARAPGNRVLYEYDFGDGWEHDLPVEKVLEPEPGATYPVCFGGRRACPPEDVGGIWGYAEFLEILSDPDHPEYEARLDWVGGEFDLEEFDVEGVNAALASLALMDIAPANPTGQRSPEVAGRGHSSRTRYGSTGVFATTGRPDLSQPTIVHVQLAAATWLPLANLCFQSGQVMG